MVQITKSAKLQLMTLTHMGQLCLAENTVIHLDVTEVLHVCPLNIKIV